MKLDTFTTHNDWEVRTVVAIDNPDDWKPGDPDRYFVRGVAIFPPAARDGFSFTSLDPLTADSAHFTDERLAPRFHAEVAVQLQLAIDARRSADW